MAMKAELIEKLIIAHCSRSENKFFEALNILINDEEKKGNVPTASRLIRAYENNKSPQKEKDADIIASASDYLPYSDTPRDKDSLLELYEIFESKTSFSDIVLPENQKRILEQVVSEQKNAKELSKHNVSPINRVLLCGPPGCGKTMTAYALGHELQLPIAYVRLDGLVSSYLGQTSTNLRKVFDAVKNKRIILFLDEFDAIAKKRDDSNELGELKRVVTTLLQNFDNMPPNVFLIAATNHEHLLDPAIWRRFNITITLELPNEEQRQALLEKWILKYGINAKIDYNILAKVSEGISGAQLEELAIAAAKRYLIDKHIKTEDIMEILIHQLTKFSYSGDEPMKIICEMMDRGVSLRAVARAMGLSHNTLDYQVKKYKGELEND